MAQDFEDIRREVVEAGGIKCLAMQILRDASPYKKLGPGVNAEISGALQQKGLSHTKLPMYQHETVYVYEQGSDPARLMAAIYGTPSEDGAKTILQAVRPDAKGKDADAKLAEIKALLIQLQDVFDEPSENELAA